MDTLIEVISITHHVIAIIASGIAIYLFATKKHIISSVFKALLNYTAQLTLSELRMKLEQLNDLRVDGGEQSTKIVNLLNEIVGQMRGNKMLSTKCSQILRKISRVAEDPASLTEPKKRSLISELREQLRHIHVENIDELIGEKNEQNH